ncbi:hypothetical protein LOZ65_000986 [Ophidiomyces ophidiicola]|nr:hypothetical protein LOZ65_000986 [Ophidiomyces ophidiicola]
MAILPLTSLLSIALAALPVYGGSQAWESSVKFALTESMAYQAALKDGNTTSSSHSNSKRYLTIQPGSGNADNHLWPNGVVTYCFEDKTWPEREGKTTKEIVFGDLATARDRWYLEGVPESFRWHEASEATCKDPKMRSEFLLIMFNLEGKLATTPGVPPKDSDNVGPRMLLSDSLSVGMLNVVANYAHEMGHAWGMHHEHQNQKFWGAPYSEAGGKFFGQGNFNCQNLKDYDDFRQKLKEKGFPQYDIERITKDVCTSRSEAIEWKFSAQDYLPIVNEPVLASKKKEPDWESIMIYPSGAGGKGSAAPGMDNRLPILKKPDGNPIPINVTPSERDVNGLKKLYGYNPKTKWTALGDKASEYKKKFDDMRRSDKDSGCSKQ